MSVSSQYLTYWPLTDSLLHVEFSSFRGRRGVLIPSENRLFLFLICRFWICARFVSLSKNEITLFSVVIRFVEARSFWKNRGGWKLKFEFASSNLLKQICDIFEANFLQIENVQIFQISASKFCFQNFAARPTFNTRDQWIFHFSTF